MGYGGLAVSFWVDAMYVAWGFMGEGRDNATNEARRGISLQ